MCSAGNGILMRKQRFYRCKNCGKITHEGERRRDFSSGIIYHIVVKMVHVGLSGSMTSKVINCGEIEELKDE